MELALLQSAAGQHLGGLGGKLDGIARRCRVGVYKLCAVNGFVVQRISGVACHKLTFALIFDVESDLVCTGIIPDAAEVVIYLADDIGLFAYVGRREIQVKLNVAVCVVRDGDGGVRNRTVCQLFTQFKQEFAPVQCAVADHDIQFLGGFQSYLNVACGIGVGKLDTIRGGTIFRNGATCHCQLAAAVVRDGNGHMVGRAVIRNTCNLILIIGGDNLGNVVLILAGFRKGDISEVKFDRRSFGGASLILHYALGIAVASSRVGQRGAIGDSLQLEGEFIVCLPSAALQNLFAIERVIGVIRGYLNLFGLIGVCHRDFFGCTCRDRARAAVCNATGIVGGQIFFRDGIGAACGQAHNVGSLVFFQGESTAVLDGLGTLSAGNGVVVRGIGVHVIARQLKLHRKFGVGVRGQTLVGFHLLSNLQAACGVHGQLTVVAKVQHTLVCLKIPLEVNAALRGAGCVTGLTIFVFLIAQLVINGGGQAAFFGVRLDVAVAIFFFFNATFDFLISCNANGHPTGPANRISMRRRFQLQIVQLIVVGFVRVYNCGRRIIVFIRFGVQQGILGMIVEVVACCGGKGGSGRADGCFAVCRCIVFIKFVGIEADFAVLGGVFRNVGGKVGVGKFAGRNLLAHILFIFKADRVDDADGLGVVDFQLLGAIGVCDLIIPQGQHTGRDLDLHAVADTAAAMGDGDNDVAQIGCIGVGAADRVFMLTLKDIGIHIAGGFFARLRKDLVGKGDGLKALDFHIIAQGIIESHVAFFLGLVRNLRGACRCGRYRREDVRKDILQLISAGSRHIVICLVRSVAEVPFPLQGAFRSRVSGRGVVAGDRLHEFVFI